MEASASWNRKTHGKDVQRPVFAEVEKALETLRLLAATGIARSGVINLVRANHEQGNQCGDAQRGRAKEDRTLGKILAGQSHQACRQCVAKCVEPIVPPSSTRHRPPANETETDGRYGWRNNPASEAMQNLRCEHEREARHEREYQGGHADHADTDRHQTSLPADCVHQRSARGLGEDARKRACRERQTNLILRPAQIGKIKSNEGAEPGLDIGEEEIHPVEAALAPSRDRDPHRSTSVAIAREHSPEPTRPSGQASTDRLISAAEIDPHVLFRTDRPNNGPVKSARGGPL